ncbi:SDR family oxidoreductase [Paenibacillus turpanensis]|uniref:SDR family oxidoreductase n=1 Tax=Paenibacillus turpanensis TaxID=2689078 RepID=UPI00140E34D0|nr:SDR family oxidoreductase [Paenibacillus turpanensis]
MEPIRERKIALVTGGAKGLGKATALALADMGCDVAISYVRSEQEAQSLVSELQKRHVRAFAVKADMSDREAIFRMVTEIRKELGEIDIVVNNAGPFIRDRKCFIEYETADIDYLLYGNLIGVMELDRLVIPAMRQKRWGRIIHFGFGHAGETRGWQHRAVYAAAKVGLASFTKSLALEEAPYGITVNMVCPGDIRGMFKELGIAEARQHSDQETPRGRPGSGEDVARVIRFLCQDESDFITGNTIDITGGLDPIRTIVPTT